jgi:YqaJ-like viral recombinase domain
MNSEYNFIDELTAALDAEDSRGLAQISDTWKELRLGKFTSSTCNKLFAKGRRALTEAELKDEENKPVSKRRKTVEVMFGEGAETYIYKTIAETLTREANEVSSAAIKWGEENEEDAVKMFERLHGKTVLYYGKGNPVFFPYMATSEAGEIIESEHAGGSPDGLIEAENAVIETKCPYESKYHAEVLHKVLMKNFDLKQYDEDYYGQVQMNILLTKADYAYFISYDPRCVDYRFSVAVARIEKDEKYITELRERLNAAIALKMDFLKQIGYFEIA